MYLALTRDDSTNDITIVSQSCKSLAPTKMTIRVESLNSTEIPDFSSRTSRVNNNANTNLV